VSDDLVLGADQKICERWRFTISRVSCEFTQISRTVHYEIFTNRLGNHKFLTQNAENGFGFDLLEQYHKDGNDFLNHIVRVSGYKKWASFVNLETKEKSKRCMHTHSPNKPKSLNKHCLPARKLMATVFWDRKRVLMVEFMQQGTSIMSEVHGVRNTKDNA
jgi:hypothetical protein